MNVISDEEWAEVSAALVRGGLRQVIERIVIAHENDVRGEPAQVQIGEKNRAIVYRAYDDGDGHTVTLEPTDDHPWFRGVYDGSEVMLGCEYGTTLYSIVYASGGGLVSVIVGEGLVDNDAGTTFHSVPEAKAYVKGLASR